MLCVQNCWNLPSGFGEKDFQILSMYFWYFIIISPWYKMWPFSWTNLNPLHPRILCAKFGRSWPNGSGEDFKFHQCVFGISSSSPLGNLESQLLMDALCQILLKLAHWLLRRSVNFGYVFSLFCNYHPSEKGLGPSFQQNWITFNQICFLPNLVEISPVVLQKKMKMWKVYRQTETDRQVVRNAHLRLRA